VDALPVLWLYGPPGVGKTTVGWEVFTRLDVPAGYVDIDQLGMCYGPPTAGDRTPEPPDDPGRYRMKARNLDAVVVNQRAAGARLLVVSGVVDARRGVDRDLLPHAAVRTLRLRADPGELRRRLARRARPGEDISRELAYAAELEVNHADDECVDTTGLGVAEVVDRVRLDASYPSVHSGPAPARAAPGEVLLVCGVSGVGKSTVGWQVYDRIRTSGTHAAFVDLEQIGFHRPAPADHRLKAANLAALWSTYHRAGARRMVVGGEVETTQALRTYAAALPAARLTVYRLDAGADTLRERILRRGRGVGAIDLAGDPLIGRPESALREVADRAAAQARERAGVCDVLLDTDGREVSDLVDEIVRHQGRG
jgi:hypothetical protein